MSFSDLRTIIEDDKAPYSQFYHPAVHAARSFLIIEDYESNEIATTSEGEEALRKLENQK